MANIIDVEGIGPVYAGKLEAAGIKTVESLLKQAGTKKERKEIADKTGISETVILEWVNRADLSRINGVGSEYADLLENSGVDTVKELGTRNAANLHAKMVEVNEAKHLVRSVPSAAQVAKWVEEAKGLPQAVFH